MAYRADYHRYVLWVYLEAAKNIKGEYAAALRMVAAVYHIADIMHIAGYRRKLALVVAVAENFEYLPRHFGDRARVGESVFGKAQFA